MASLYLMDYMVTELLNVLKTYLLAILNYPQVLITSSESQQKVRPILSRRMFDNREHLISTGSLLCIRQLPMCFSVQYSLFLHCGWIFPWIRNTTFLLIYFFPCKTSHDQPSYPVLPNISWIDKCVYVCVCVIFPYSSPNF